MTIGQRTRRVLSALKMLHRDSVVKIDCIVKVSGWKPWDFSLFSIKVDLLWRAVWSAT